MTTATLPQRAELVPTGTWRIDPARSTVGFAVRHLLAASVYGRFTRFDGVLEHHAWGTGIRGAVQTASVDTGNPARDKRLCEPGFFDAAAHPEIGFVARGVVPVSAGELRVLGDLTIAGVTRPIRLATTVDRHGAHDRVTITARGSVRRSDFGIESKSLLEAGVGDRVALLLDLSLVKE